MRGFSFLAFVGLTILMWGVYGPVLHLGQEALGDGQRLSRWQPFMCVGMAYFLVAVLYPAIMLRREGVGNWAPAGILWSFLAGVIGAVGALGIILAFMFGGSPVFIMPLVFGFAPVINTLVSMLMTRTIHQASLIFYLGVLVVAIGAAGVMFFKPVPETTSRMPQPTASQTSSPKDASIAPDSRAAGDQHFGWMVASVVLTALCWGSYGPVLHKGQTRMGGSRLRPLLFVGLAYFAIAVAVPLLLRGVLPPDPGPWNQQGILWSLIAGTAGAVGALGIIYAFHFGGKPLSIMPLVFGGAPVINTLISTMADRTLSQLSYAFYISLFLVIAGAVTVLSNAPSGTTKRAQE